MDQPLDYIVSRTADRHKAFSQTACGLMVGGVYFGAVPVELVKEITPAKVAVKNIMKLVAVNPSVVLRRVDMLSDIAAEMDVDQLEPLADTEHGAFFCSKPGQNLKL